MQAKRIQVAHNDVAVNAQSNVTIAVPSDTREQVNFHNIWGGFNCESVTAGANAQGTWVLYLLPEGKTAPTWSNGEINSEDNNMNIIACGVWGCSNEMPSGEKIQIGTSRNANAGDQLVPSVFVYGSTSGNVSIHSVLCAHTTRR